MCIANIKIYKNLKIREPDKYDINITPRVLIRSERLSKGGLGAQIMELTRSWTLSKILDARLLLADTISEHGHTMSRLLRTNINFGSIKGNFCYVNELVKSDVIDNYIDSACRGNKINTSGTGVLYKNLKGCGLIIYQGRHKNEQDRKCHTAIRSMAEYILGNNSIKTPFFGINIHIRYGDLTLPKFSSQLSKEGRTIDVKYINMLMLCELNTTIRIFMKKSNTTILDKIIGEYKLIDTSNDIDDLRELINAKVLMLSTSDYAKIASVMSKAKMVLVHSNSEAKMSWKTDVSKKYIYYDKLNSNEFCSAVKEAIIL